MKRTAILLALALALSPFGVTRAADLLQLQKSVRTLESLQDKTANGDAEAARLQPRLIAQIENDIRLSPDHALRNPGNLRALATLLLSGANPNLVEAQTLNLPMDEDMQNLISGALAYARADREGAAKLLAKVNVDHLPPSLAGRVALVRSIIGASDNAIRAIDDLHVARELMPGTLVEEASLRRCVAFAGRLADKQRLSFCSGRYIRRFPRSLYFQEFADSFAEAVAQSGFGEGDELDQLLERLKRLNVKDRRSLLLQLARLSLTHGRHGLAANLAERARDLSLAGSADMARARLYLAAANIAGSQPSGMDDMLEAIETASLSSADTKLLADAKRLTKAISTLPNMDLAKARQLALEDMLPTEDASMAAAKAAAQQTLAQAEQLGAPAPKQAKP